MVGPFDPSADLGRGGEHEVVAAGGLDRALRVRVVAVAPLAAPAHDALLGKVEEPGGGELAQVIARRGLGNAELAAQLGRGQGSPAEEGDHPQDE